MRKIMAALIAANLLILNLYSNDEEIKVKSKIDSIGLFKNGLAVIKRTVSIPAPGAYVIEDAPEPVHGTFWIKSDAAVIARSRLRRIEVPAKKTPVDFQDSFAGKNVIIYFKTEGLVPLKGKVLKIDSEVTPEWNRNYQSGRYDYWSSYYPAPGAGQYAPNGNYLKLKTTSGTTYIDSSLIAYIQSDGENSKVMKKKPVLIFEVGKMPDKPAVISITYLTKGISWTPGYLLDLSDSKTLTIEQNAVIKNEFADFTDADIQLISGFPNIKFAHVTSPLSPETNWASFFSQLNQEFFIPGHASTMNAMAQMQAASPSSFPSGIDLSSNTGEGVDIHYQKIGAHSMKEGDSLTLSVDKKNSEYEKIIEWIIPDTRNPEGRYIQEYERRENPEKYEDAAWDAVRFKNPFSFPMTTGAAMIIANGNFQGQTMSYWANSGDSNVLHITKALSVQTKTSEHELEGKREIAYIGGNDYQETTVEGELSAKNHRKETVTLLIRRCFSGELLNSDGNPKCELREEGVYSVNKRNELTWDMTLKPGEEKTLKYHYKVLVDM